jgi:hypothetical protein
MRTPISPYLRWLGRLALFAGVALLASALLLPMLRIHTLDAALPEAAAKFQGFATHPDRPNAVVLGSSVVRHHMVPAVFDSITGLTWYNGGLSASFPPEALLVAEEFIAGVAPGSVTTVVVDVLPSNAPAWENAGTLRAAFPISVAEMARRVFHARSLDDGRTAVETWMTHVLHFARHQDALAAAVPEKELAARGYAQLTEEENPGPWISAEHAKLLNQPDSVLAIIRATSADFRFRETAEDPTTGWTCDRRTDEAIARMQSLLDAAAAKDIHLIFHFQKLWDTNGCVYFAARKAFGPCHVTESMGWPAAGDTLTANDCFDPAHLAPSGAEKWSRYAAEKIQAARACRGSDI